MSGGFNFLVTGLEERYDYQSARSVAREALAAAGLEEAAKYSDGDLQKFVDALVGLGGGHLDKVWGKLGTAPAGQSVPAAEPPAIPAAPAKAEKKAEKKDDKAEKKDDKAEKKDDKKDDKAEKKDDKKPAKKKK